MPSPQLLRPAGPVRSLILPFFLTLCAWRVCLCSAGNTTAPEPWQAGWKDTVAVPVGMTTKVIATFDRPGPYMLHCHILEHEVR